MEWQLALLLIFGGMLILMISGMHVAFVFLLINILGGIYFWSGEAGLKFLTLSLFESVGKFMLVPIPLYVLMGEVMFRSGIAPRMIDTIDKWVGRLPGRLGLLAVGGGTVFAVMSGVSVSSMAMLGSVLLPEMEKRGYKKSMTLGPILGSGGLAIMIPPTALGVLLAAIAQISIGKLLIAIILPGLLMAVLFSSYIILRCRLQPSIAPAYDLPPTPLSEKITATVRYILPLGFIIFLVLGLIFLGVTTPTEAAATGALGTFLLAAAYGKLSWQLVRKSVGDTLRITVGMLMIIVGVTAFGQILAFSGASRGLAEVVTDLPVAPIFIVVAMQVVVLIMGMFMETVAIMMMTLPIFVPIVQALGLDPVWFGVIMLLNIEMSIISPPYGLGLFVMKNVAPRGTTMGDVYRAALPFLGLDLVVMALLIAFPQIALWLPSLMR